MPAPQLHLERDVDAYHVKGQRVPSVTEILALAGLVDFTSVPVEVLQAAADRGRLAHAHTARLDAAPEGVSLVESLLSVPDEIQGYAKAWLRFRDDTGFSPLLIEQPVVSCAYGYAGTLDRFGVVPDATIYLIDLKTGSSLPTWVGLQLAGYEQALRESSPLMAKGDRVQRLAVRLRADGEYSVKLFSNPGDRMDFLAAARVAQWRIREEGIRL